jgi:two-component system sensor histidine kinase KdpD
VTVAAAVLLLLALRAQVNLTTAALTLVVAVLVPALYWGSRAGLVAALLALLSFNYFFIPPIHTWAIRDPENLVAFAVFTITALTVGQLSSRARRKAEEAEARRLEIERLYEELRKAFEQASEAETLRRSEKLKTALLDAVTHDLRTPLTSIKAAATPLLGDGKASVLDEEGRRELLSVIDEESDRLNRFVEEMMELAQIEGGHLLLRRGRVSTSEIVNAALDRAASALATHPVEVAIADKLPLLQVDAASVSGVVFELLENAARYSPPGAPIVVSAHHSGTDQVEISVEDEGSGIAPEYRERVFEKFFREPHPPGGKHGFDRHSFDKQGFGVGLAIARGIVEAHGGQIRAEARNGSRGTVVRFTVPCERGVEAQGGQTD